MEGLRKKWGTFCSFTLVGFFFFFFFFFFWLLHPFTCLEAIKPGVSKGGAASFLQAAALAAV